MVANNYRTPALSKPIKVPNHYATKIVLILAINNNDSTSMITYWKLIELHAYFVYLFHVTGDRRVFCVLFVLLLIFFILFLIYICFALFYFAFFAFVLLFIFCFIAFIGFLYYNFFVLFLRFFFLFSFFFCSSPIYNYLHLINNTCNEPPPTKAIYIYVLQFTLQLI